MKSVMFNDVVNIHILLILMSISLHKKTILKIWCTKNYITMTSQPVALFVNC